MRYRYIRMCSRVVCLSLLLLQIVSFAHGQCSVPTNLALQQRSPVFLGFNNFFKYPHAKNTKELSFDWYEDRLLYCPGGTLSMSIAGQPDVSLNPVDSDPYLLPPVVRCLSGDKFILQSENGYEQKVSLDQFKCSEYPVAISYYHFEGNSPKQCSNLNGNIGVIVNLGFVIDAPAEKSLAVIQLCYEDARATTIWSHHILSPAASGRVVFKTSKNDAIRWDFEPGHVFEGLKMKKLYKACEEAEAFGRLLKDPVMEQLELKDYYGNQITDERLLQPSQIEELKDELKVAVERYIYWNTTNHADNTMLVKGHLAPRADFFYLVEERSTFFFSNALPMWHTINGGHWLEMEKWVRKLANKKECFLDVWTGGLRTMKIHGKLINLGQRLTERKMGASASVIPVVPVPEILFKIVRCQALNEAIVFLAINDPLLELDGMDAEEHIHCIKDYQLCRLLKAHWYLPDNTRKGFTYCCEYHDFINHPVAQEISIPIEQMPPDVQPLIRDASDLLRVKRNIHLTSVARTPDMAVMLSSRLAILILLAAAHCGICAEAKCRIDLNKDVTASSPLFLSIGSLEPIYPERSSPQLLTFNSGQKHLLYCPGGQITRFERTTNSSTELAKCLDGKSFSSVPYHNLEYSFDQVACSKNPSPVTRSNNRHKCSSDGVLVEIGYQVKDSGFQRTIQVCHSRNLATTSWAHSTIRGAIGGSKVFRDAGAPTFSKGQFFENVVMNKVYPRNHQVATFANIFNQDKSLVERYLPSTGPSKNYLVRGHLVARADQFYYAEQYSTYSYLNVLPMWQSVNNGNWKSVESMVRRTASVIGDLEVYTGGLGILQLSGKEIYLSHDRHDSLKLLVPVPKLLFKLAYSPTLHQALVFVTVNNPYLTDSDIRSNDLRICRQEHQSCRSTQFDKTNEGFTYCCLHEDFVSSDAANLLTLPLTLRNVAPLRLY
ncbi:uncharacterized protein LOC100123953 [Nasonia vitripennis]|uniref:DNA/RNA non-specific endonuclease domain-containing protein n=1 Tax=Nasonia vitripennis TaxID=7425 RepID=A0A7M7IYM9_NASVI|nr:uncharacterized protein LOC100123953 [Nasonia vitripennis]